MISLATIVDTEALLETVAASFAAGLSVTFAFAVAIFGATRFADMRAEERTFAAGAYGVLSILALMVVVAAIVFGLIVMTSE